MPDQYSDEDHEVRIERKRAAEIRAHYDPKTVHENEQLKRGNAPFVVMVPQIGGFPARPFYFRLEPFARQFAKETGGTLYVRALTERE